MQNKTIKILAFAALTIVIALLIMLYKTHVKLSKIEAALAENVELQDTSKQIPFDSLSYLDVPSRSTEIKNEEKTIETPSKKMFSGEKSSSQTIATLYPTNADWEKRLKMPLRSELNSIISAKPSLGALINSDTVKFEWRTKHTEPKIYLGILDHLNKEIYFGEIRGNQFSFNTKEKNLKDGVYYWILESETDVLYASKFILSRQSEHM